MTPTIHQTLAIRGGAKNAYVAIRSQHKFMLRLHVAISCCNQMSIFQLDFPFLLLSISQNWNSAFTIAFFGLDFPSPLLSISQNWDSAFITAFFAFILRGNIALMCKESLACD